MFTAANILTYSNFVLRRGGRIFSTVNQKLVWYYFYENPCAVISICLCRYIRKLIVFHAFYLLLIALVEYLICGFFWFIQIKLKFIFPIQGGICSANLGLTLIIFAIIWFLCVRRNFILEYSLNGISAQFQYTNKGFVLRIVWLNGLIFPIESIYCILYFYVL